jgi:hypothetical protein
LPAMRPLGESPKGRAERRTFRKEGCGVAAFWSSAITDGLARAVTLLGDFAPVIALSLGLLIFGWVASLIRGGGS